MSKAPATEWSIRRQISFLPAPSLRRNFRASLSLRQGQSIASRAQRATPESVPKLQRRCPLLSALSWDCAKEGVHTIVWRGAGLAHFHVFNELLFGKPVPSSSQNMSFHVPPWMNQKGETD